MRRCCAWCAEERRKIIARLAKNALRKRKSFQQEERLDAALMGLQLAGYMRKIEPPHETGRPAMLKFELHPSLLVKTDAS